jgi:hypothetical protein
MMNLYKLIYLVLLVPFALNASPIDKFKKSKRIQKSYEVNSDATLDVNNKYGDVTISSWDKKSISIEVIVEVSGNKEEDVNDRLQKIDVDFNGSRGKVSARSKIPSQDNKLLGFFTGGSNTSIKINYSIKIPRNSAVDVSNDYGAIIIDKLQGPATISCDYGRLQIGQLLNTTNNLSFDYTENSHIDYLKAGTIKADFSSFTVHGADELSFSGDYTTANLPELKELDYNSDFATIKIAGVHILNGRGDYSTVRVKELTDSAQINADYGTFYLENIAPGFTSIAIKSDFTTVKLGYNRSTGFKYFLNTEYGNQKLDSYLNTTESRNDGSDAYKEGFHLDENTSSRIEVDTSFGSLSLYQSNK